MLGGMVGMALAMMVRTRWWLAGEVSAPRDRPRRRRGAAHRPLWCGTDGLCASRRAIRATVRDPGRRGAHGRPRLRPWPHVCLAQVVQRWAQRRVVALERRSVKGPPARVETLRRRAQGAGVSTTAAIARRNATVRDRLAALTRRGRALARRPRTLQHGMYLIGTGDHVCTPHARLSGGGSATPPAMASGITDHGWSVQALLYDHVPPPQWTPPTQRGCPSPALKRLMKRWCGDHG